MKVDTHTPTQLIIRDSATGVRAFGAVLVAFAGYILFRFALSEGQSDRAFLVRIAVVVALAGVALIVLPRRRTFAFSKSDRVFVIASERLIGGRVERETYALSDIADVSLDEAKATDTERARDSTYRVIVTLRDQRQIPWTSYWTAGAGPKQEAVSLVREFLGFEPARAPGVAAPTADAERTARRSRRTLVAGGIVACMFLGVGVYLLALEQQHLSAFQPVSATVLRTRVIKAHSGPPPTYEPVVVYQYRVRDRDYTAGLVMPVRESGNEKWATRVAGDFHVGSTYTAYYNPNNPGEAFLVRTRSATPWELVGMSLLGLVFIVFVYRSRPTTVDPAYAR